MTRQADLDPEQLRDHAGTVAGVARDLSAAAGGLPALRAGALGPFVRFLTTGLAEARTVTADGVRRAADAMAATSAGLVRVADGDSDDNGARWCRLTVIDATLDDLTATRRAMRAGTWRVGDAAPEQVGAPRVDPLSALDGVGLGFLTELVAFLGEPLHQLAGPPGAAADGFAGAGQRVSAIADRYGRTVGPETSEWVDPAALAYLRAGADLAGGLVGLGEATHAVGEAAAGARAAVAAAVVEVTALVAEATDKINLIMNRGLAVAPVTAGLSVAAGIPQCVRVAAAYAARIVAIMGTLLSSARNLLRYVQSTAAAVSTLTDALAAVAAPASATGVSRRRGARGTPRPAGTSGGSAS